MIEGRSSTASQGLFGRRDATASVEVASLMTAPRESVPNMGVWSSMKRSLG